MSKLRIAVVTEGYDGLNDVVSHVFGKTKTFTIVTLEDKQIKDVEVVENPASAYHQGSGPIASKTLAELKVDRVITSQLGPGASSLLDFHKIATVIMESEITVSEALNKAHFL